MLTNFLRIHLILILFTGFETFMAQLAFSSYPPDTAIRLQEDLLCKLSFYTESQELDFSKSTKHLQTPLSFEDCIYLQAISAYSFLDDYKDNGLIGFVEYKYENHYINCEISLRTAFNDLDSFALKQFLDLNNQHYEDLKTSLSVAMLNNYFTQKDWVKQFADFLINTEDCF